MELVWFNPRDFEGNPLGLSSEATDNTQLKSEGA